MITFNFSKCLWKEALTHLQWVCQSTRTTEDGARTVELYCLNSFWFLNIHTNKLVTYSFLLCKPEHNRTCSALVLTVFVCSSVVQWSSDGFRFWHRKAAQTVQKWTCGASPVVSGLVHDGAITECVPRRWRQLGSWSTLPGVFSSLVPPFLFASDL